MQNDVIRSEEHKKSEQRVWVQVYKDALISAISLTFSNGNTFF